MEESTSTTCSSSSSASLSWHSPREPCISSTSHKGHLGYSPQVLHIYRCNTYCSLLHLPHQSAVLKLNNITLLPLLGHEGGIM